MVECCSCGVLYVNPRRMNSQAHYSAGAVEPKYEAILLGQASHPRDKNYLEHLAMIEAAKPDGNFLDIGTHCGFFLHHARGRGWTLYGVEPSPYSSEAARRYYGLNVVTGYLTDSAFPDAFFDVITMVDVFEHVPLPHQLLTEVRRITKPDAVLFIKVPHAKWNLLKHLFFVRLMRRRNYMVFDAKEHLVHYTDSALKELLKQYGFNKVNFYVPSPIRSSGGMTHLLRRLSVSIGRLWFRLSGRLSPMVTDIAVLASRS